MIPTTMRESHQALAWDPLQRPWAPGGVLKFGFGRDVPPRKSKVDPYKCQFFKKKWPIHIPIGPFFGQVLSKITWFFQNFLKFEPILAQIWGTFEKSTHSYTKFCILLGVTHTKRLILLPMLAAHPRRVFCTKYPPGPERSREHSMFAIVAVLRQWASSKWYQIQLSYCFTETFGMFLFCLFIKHIHTLQCHYNNTDIQSTLDIIK